MSSGLKDAPAAHKTADGNAIAVPVKPMQIGVGDSFGAEGRDGLQPKPQLNGVRLKMPNQSEVYLIDQGLRRHIPNGDTYNNLFRNWEGIIVDIDIDEIPLGTSIANGAVLARAAGTAPVYLVDQGQKRHVSTGPVMDRYHFAWQRVCVVPAALLDGLPTGPPIL